MPVTKFKTLAVKNTKINNPVLLPNKNISTDLNESFTPLLITTNTAGSGDITYKNDIIRKINVFIKFYRILYACKRITNGVFQ